MVWLEFVGRVGESIEFLRDEDRVDPARLALLRRVKIPVGRMDDVDPFDFPRNRIDAVSLASALRCTQAESWRKTLICPV